MSSKKQLFINLSTALMVLFINIFINFGLSSYIVEKTSEEAYGFISLANNFISYATIFTMAINSMASRFITIDVHKKKFDSANKYFSSVFIANLFIVLFLIVPSIIFVLNLEKIINISPHIVIDVKILFTLIILNFFVTLLGGVFTIATYCTNKLYLTSIKNLEASIIKMVIIVSSFMLLKPTIFYVGIATITSSLFIVYYNIKFTKELLPKVKIKNENFSIEKIKILLSSGLWNSITNLGNILADGLDLIISNIMVDPSSMGIVALSKIPSNIFNTILSSITNVFQPQILSHYSKGDLNGVVEETKKSMKISGIFGNIPFCYVLIFGTCFCSVWMPKIDINMLSTLCIITFINIFVSGITNTLYNIFTITNRVKIVAILNVFCGLISTGLVFLLLKFTKLGVYAIVGVSTIVWAIKGIIIVPIYVAKCLNVQYKTFFAEIMKYFLSTFVMTIVFMAIKIIIVPNNWISVLFTVFVCGIFGIAVNYYLLLDYQDRIELLNAIKVRLKYIINKEKVNEK